MIDTIIAFVEWCKRAALVGSWAVAIGYLFIKAINGDVWAAIGLVGTLAWNFIQQKEVAAHKPAKPVNLLELTSAAIERDIERTRSR